MIVNVFMKNTKQYFDLCFILFKIILISLKV